MKVSPLILILTLALIASYNLAGQSIKKPDEQNNTRGIASIVAIHQSVRTENANGLLLHPTLKKEIRREIQDEKERLALKFEEEKRRLTITSIIIPTFIIMMILVTTAYTIQIRKARSKREHLAIVKEQNSYLERQVTARTKELKEKNEELQKLSTYKEKLTQMIMHDLKNPLNVMLSLASSDKLGKCGLLVKQASNDMLQMVNNMMDVQQFKETKMNLEMGKHSIMGLIEQSLSRVESLLSAKSIDCGLFVSSNHRAYCDKEIIVRVVINLMTNAIKFTESGGSIAVNVEIEANDLKIAISDNGKGIEEKHLPHIFDEYFHTSLSKSGPVRSTGLGLTFCKMAIEAHDGCIWATSKVGEGSTFFFTLPSAYVGKKSERISNLYQPSVQLTDQNKLDIARHVEELSNIPIYHVGSILKILRKIPENDANMRNWKQAIHQSFCNWNEKRYQQLIELASISCDVENV